MAVLAVFVMNASVLDPIEDMSSCSTLNTYFPGVNPKLTFTIFKMSFEHDPGKINIVPRPLSKPALAGLPPNPEQL